MVSLSQSVALFSTALTLGFTASLISSADGRVNADHSTDMSPFMRHSVVAGSRQPNPWVNLRQGILPSHYTGSAGPAAVLNHELAVPSALASADFDEDGVPDLAVGYVGPGSGLLTFYRGNDHVFQSPKSGGAEQIAPSPLCSPISCSPAPFFPEARLFEVPDPPDFLGAGDFDADGHWDVVAAAREGENLYWLPGDGQGNFGPAQRVPLPGRVTAVVTGEINRADGLTDVVVAVRGKQESQAIVFESPTGALQDPPETLLLPAEAASLALGQLDSSPEMDLVIAADHELLVVHGRDRKLSQDDLRRAEVPSAKISQQRMPCAIRSLALGDFVGDKNHRTDIALVGDDGEVHLLSLEDGGGNAGGYRLPRHEATTVSVGATVAGCPPSGVHLLRANVSSLPTDDLIVLDQANSQVHILSDLSSNQSAIRNPKSEIATSAILSADGPPVAVLPMHLNADALSDLVVLRRDRIAPMILLTAAATTFIVNSTADAPDATIGDGVCDAGGGSCTLRAAIQEANATSGLDQINFNIPGEGPHTISPAGSPLPIITDPVTIDGYTQVIARPNTNPSTMGSNAVVMIELDGTNAVAGSASGFRISAGNTTIQGLAINRFLGAGILIETSGGNIIRGNFIGTDLAGRSDLGNSTGTLIINSPNNTVGGTTAAARNVISGNNFKGVEIAFNQATGNQVQGNLIGTDITGASDLGNSTYGVSLQQGAPMNVIGGTTAQAGNVISGNDDSGINLEESGTTANLVQGNLIGTDVTGAVDLGNRSRGVRIANAPNNSVGGTTPEARNIISGNDEFGIAVSSFGGGTASGNLVQGNYIGTDITGTIDLGNSTEGMSISVTSNTLVGGTTAEARNVISGNDGAGIVILGATGTLVQGNFIGTQANGTSALKNNADGIIIAVRAANNTIGGTSTRAGNVIAFNGGPGVSIPNSGLPPPQGPAHPTGNAILSNSIFSNGGLGIDLGGAGVTTNDTNDSDDGANNLQNFPVLTSALCGVSFEGTLTSTPNTTFRLEFFMNDACDPSGNGEGQKLFASINVTTPANGSVIFSVPLPQAVAANKFLTSTVTDSNNNTSEFSACRRVTNSPPTARAGIDQLVDEGAVVELLAAGTDLDRGQSLSFQWTQTAGPPVTLQNANTRRARFTAPDVPEAQCSVLTFQLEVTDSCGVKDTDSIIVQVSDRLSLSDDVSGNCVRINACTNTHFFKTATSTTFTGAVAITLATGAVTFQSPPSEPNLLTGRVDLVQRRAEAELQVPRGGRVRLRINDSNIDNNRECR